MSCALGLLKVTAWIKARVSGFLRYKTEANRTSPIKLWSEIATSKYTVGGFVSSLDGV
jgi:hypothetical protein